MVSRLALHGGKPVRPALLPYGRQQLDDDDIAAVTGVLRSDWLTTGPKVKEFEDAFAKLVGAREAVSVSSGTAALHTAMYALGIGPGDEVIVPAMTFAATANAVVFQGGTPVFADVEPETLLVDPDQVRRKITSRSRAIIAVDYAGQPCAYEALSEISIEHGLALISDACHSLGALYKERPAGVLSDLSTFSLHPVKHVTSGEGGLVITESASLASRMRMFRNHGITADWHQRARENSWFYEVNDLGYNYRLTDFQCALGLSQLEKLPMWLARRREIARHYDQALSLNALVQPLQVRPEVSHAYHLYVVRLALDRLGADRGMIYSALRAEGIGANVHYIPVHLHPFYRHRFGTGPGLCPVSEAAYEQVLSLPIFPSMSDQDIEDVPAALNKVLEAYRR